jgi:hypothetical protein
MKNLFLFILLLVVSVVSVSAQTDSTSTYKRPARTTVSRRDTMSLVRLNNSSNLMLASGVGLCGIGGYLIFQGNKVYTTTPDALPATATAEQKAIREGEIEKNHKQGTIYYAVGGIAIGAGIILTAFGAKNKVEFKQRKRMLEMQSGILDNGHLGAMLTF